MKFIIYVLKIIGHLNIILNVISYLKNQKMFLWKFALLTFYRFYKWMYNLKYFLKLQAMFKEELINMFNPRMIIIMLIGILQKYNLKYIYLSN